MTDHEKRHRVYTYTLKRTALEDSAPIALTDIPSLARMFRGQIRHDDREQYLVAYMNASSVVIGVDVVAIGTATSVKVCPMLTFRTAVALGARCIALCHNHPSGTVQPSVADKRLTVRLMAVGHVLEVPVLDHVIVSADNDDYFSFQEHSLFKVLDVEARATVQLVMS